MAEPWLEGGYEAILVDPQHPAGVNVDGRVTRIGHVIDHPVTWRVLRQAIKTRPIAFVAGFPPCTDLAVSGARWFETKARADWAFQFKAMHVVWQCQVIGEMSGAPWMVENPVSVISRIWRLRDHAFDPHQFTGHEPSDNYTKQTSLWVGGGFVMPSEFKDSSLGAPDNRIHTAPPSVDRANFRSATPRGFARAVYQANGAL